MNAIVCFSAASWQSTPTRTQQLMTRLKGVEVLFFEPPAAPGSRAHKKPGRKVRPGVTAYTLPSVAEEGPALRLRQRRAQRRLADYVQGVLRRHGVRDPLLWCAAPQAVSLLDYLPYKGLVYDCDRYWAELDPALESELAAQADVIFAASAGLADRLGPCCDNIAVVPNGCNYPMFAREDIAVPGPVKDIVGPLIGYAGTLWADLDYRPVLTCVAAHPDWNYIFLGKAQPSPGLKKLRAMKQVILCDRVPLIEVPDYIRQFDVCMDLQRQGVASDVCPGRVFEYLASGKPLVRHSYPGQMEDFPPGVAYQSPDLHGFVACCEQAIREDSAWLKGRRRELGQAAGWDKRAQAVQDILEMNMLL